MKRYLVICILSLLPVISYSQSVLGIKFGSSYDVVKAALEERFGRYSVYETNGTLKVYNINVGEFPFDSGTFEFQIDDGRTYFYFAEFDERYPLSNKSVAISNRDYMFSIISDKYDYVESYVNKDGFKCYKFGDNPLDKNKVLGMIILTKGVGNDGISRYYLYLQYGPIYYVDRTTDF